MKKRSVYIYISGLAVMLAAVLGAGSILYHMCTPMVVSATKSSSLTSDSIKEKEAQIAARKKEKDTLKNGLSDLQKIKKSLEAQKEDLQKYVTELDQNLAQIEAHIAELQEAIRVKEAEIAQTEAELELALEVETKQQEAMMVHIRLMYERGNPSVVDLLLNSSSLSDFLNRADYVEKVASYDQQLWQDYKTAREYVELCMEALEVEKDILDETKAGVVAEQQAVEELIEQKKNDIMSYMNDIGKKEKAIEEYQKEIEARDEEIKLLEEAVAEEKKKLLAAQRLTYDGGIFTFPMATYTRVSSEFGYRPDPFLGVQSFHSGIDFAAPKGTAIYAAYDGKVVAASYSSNMGNYVMIDHGDELYTIYMHASALYVNKGDVVVAGETIAAVGSTGRSTGPHLHFSVRLKGAYVSPWSYLGR